MNTILALDASGESCSVSLRLANGEITTCISEVPRAHAAKLLPFIDQLLSDASLSLSAVDAIACAVGPGSFTGLRIALGVAQGLAYGASLPVIPVCTLAAMVWHQKADQSDVIFIPLLDARMTEVYWGAYHLDAKPIDATLLARVSGEQEFNSELSALAKQQPLIAVGDAWLQVPFAAALAEELNLTTANSHAPLSEAVAELAACAERPLAPQEVDLLYCRNSVAWDKRQRIRS